MCVTAFPRPLWKLYPFQTHPLSSGVYLAALFVKRCFLIASCVGSSVALLSCGRLGFISRFVRFPTLMEITMEHRSFKRAIVCTYVWLFLLNYLTDFKNQSVSFLFSKSRALKNNSIQIKHLFIKMMYDFDSEVIIISSTIEGSADFNQNRIKKLQ